MVEPSGHKEAERRRPQKQAQADGEVRTAFDIFGSDLPDEVFSGVFDQKRPKNWRDVEEESSDPALK